MAKRLPGHTGNLLAGHDGVDHQIALVDDKGNVAVGGAVAAGATDSGNPVKVGGVYNSTQPTLTNGQRGNLELNASGEVRVSVQQTGNVLNIANASDAGGGAGTLGAWTNARMHAYNATATNFNLWRNNNDITVLASAARTATNQSADITNYNGRGLHLVIDVTAISATPSVVFTIQGKDALSGKYYTILASAAVVGTGTTVLKVYPGITAAANLSVSDILPRTWRIDATHADADSITYSVGASVIL